MNNKEDSKRKKFKKLIIKLAEQDSLKEVNSKRRILLEFRNLYISNNQIVFHHFYSDIFPILTKLKEERQAIEIVGINLGILYSDIDEKDILKQPFKKLLDHTNLEISRISYITSIDARMDMTGQELRKKYEEINEKAEEIRPKVDDLEKKANNSYSEFISILSIFSAVVLVYFGGTSILGNVLSTMSKTFVLKSIANSMVVGIILLNIIFVFIYFLSKLLDRSISSTNEEFFYRNFIIRTREKYPIMFYVNVFFLAILSLDVFTWLIYSLNKEFNLIQYILRYFFNQDIYYKLLMIIVLIWIVFDIIFVAYYIYGKFAGKLTGNVIEINYIDSTKLIRENNHWYVLDDWEETKELDNLFKVLQFITVRGLKRIKIRIFNILRRLFKRYPKVVLFNFAVVLSIFVIFKFYIK